jgi:hypothetical protein
MPEMQLSLISSLNKNFLGYGFENPFNLRLKRAAPVRFQEK